MCILVRLCGQEIRKKMYVILEATMYIDAFRTYFMYPIWSPTTYLYT